MGTAYRPVVPSEPALSRKSRSGTVPRNKPRAPLRITPISGYLIGATRAYRDRGPRASVSDVILAGLSPCGSVHPVTGTR